MSSNLARRLGFYLGVAALVLLYVAVTTSAGETGTAAARGAATSGGILGSILAKRLTMAAAAVAVWLAVDSLLVRSWRGGDWMIVYLVRVLIGWGALLSLGAMLSAGHQRLLAAAIVFAVTAAFVGLWIGALAKRSRDQNASIRPE